MCQLSKTNCPSVSRVDRNPRRCYCTGSVPAIWQLHWRYGRCKYPVNFLYNPLWEVTASVTVDGTDYYKTNKRNCFFSLKLYLTLLIIMPAMMTDNVDDDDHDDDNIINKNLKYLGVK